MNWITSFIHRHQLVNILSLFIFVAGFFALTSTHIDTLPPLDFKGIKIRVSYPEASPEDIEQYVIFPLEEKLSNYPGMKSMSSTSSHGRGRLSIFFPPDVDNMIPIVADIKERLELLKPQLPSGIRSITVRERKIQSTFLKYIYIKNLDLSKEDQIAKIETLKSRISSVKGIASVEDGIPEKNLIVDFNEGKLKERESSSEQALQKIRSFLNYVPLGNMSRGNKRTIFEFKHLDQETLLNEVQNLPVTSNAFGYQTLLKDVAEVKFDYEVQSSKLYSPQGEMYFLRIEKDLHSDILVLDRKISSIIDTFNEKHAPLFVDTVLSGKSFISRQLNALKSNGILGGILVFVLLFVVLSFRSALCTLWGLPLAYAGTFLVLFALGININMLSIVGLILVSGILVDDALIVTEKYNELIRKGLSPSDAAKTTVIELFTPVLGTALTTLVAFLPLILIPSDLGNILISIPVVVISALTFSILESFFVLPSHLVMFNSRYSPSFIERYFLKLVQLYKNLIQFIIRLRYPALACLMAFSAFSVWYTNDVEKDFNLNIQDSVVVIRGKLTQSKSKQDTVKKVNHIANYVRSLASSENYSDVSVKAGNLWVQQEELIGDNLFQITTWVNEDHPHPKQVEKDLQAKLRTFIDKEKNNNPVYDFINVQTGFQEGENEEQKYLRIKFFSKHSSSVINFQEEFRGFSDGIEGLEEIELAETSAVGKWVFAPNMKKMARVGVSREMIKNTMLGRVQDMWIEDARIGGKGLPIKIRVNGREVMNKGFDPDKFFVLSKSNEKISLSKLGTWDFVKGPASIRHENGFKLQTAEFPISDNSKRDLIIKSAREKLGPIKEKFSNFIINLTGESLREKENKAWVFKAFICCLLGIYLVLVLTLGSLLQPFIVSLPIVFGVIGVLLAHKTHGIPIGVLSGVGLIGAVGVSVNGSLIMADQINLRLRKLKQVNAMEVIALGATNRFRAIVLTSMTTLGGLFPMAYGLGGDAGFTRPLAFSMAWGIFVSAFLTLFFFPPIFGILVDIQNLARRFSNGNPLKRNPVKPTTPRDLTWIESSHPDRVEGPRSDREYET